MKKSELRQIIKEVISEQMVEWRDGGASAKLGKFSAEAERISKASKNASEIELKKKAEEEAAKKAKKGTPKYKEIFNSLFRDVIYLNDKATMSKSEFNKKYGNVDPRKKTHYQAMSRAIKFECEKKNITFFFVHIGSLLFHWHRLTSWCHNY